ncbi:glutaredoxin 3 [Sphingomicrobium sediminis]|uniref:Glutaredoxin n=1 Tax=Sphingomicrobium sediminis TaxID=2950949 RepID=A0A9X2EE99_9SPHN|nr:glutaredoxin 3 [Sphingomicrobium sediminis]MCM8556380.1 glutaredoxin 3 [Sphingomicrobium sediminis]
MAKVELYIKATCPYCIRAKRLLDMKGVDYVEYEISGDEEKRAEMIQRSGGGMTVPQIFIDDVLVGGSDELFALERAGELDQKLAA